MQHENIEIKPVPSVFRSFLGLSVVLQKTEQFYMGTAFFSTFGIIKMNALCFAIYYENAERKNVERKNIERKRSKNKRRRKNSRMKKDRKRKMSII